MSICKWVYIYKTLFAYVYNVYMCMYVYNVYMCGSVYMLMYVICGLYLYVDAQMHVHTSTHVCMIVHM